MTKIIFILFFTTMSFSLDCKAENNSEKNFSSNSSPLNLSILSLFGDSNKYYGHLVRVIGYVVVDEYDSIVMFPSACFYDNGYTFLNSISLGFVCENCKTGKDKKNFYDKLKHGYNKKYVLVEGVFDKNNNFLSSFKIVGIKRFEVWEKPDENQILW